MRQLNVPFNGGIGSYALVLMITSFLQQFERRHIAKTEHYSNLGVLLTEFMRYYGRVRSSLHFQLIDMFRNSISMQLG